MHVDVNQMSQNKHTDSEMRFGSKQQPVNLTCHLYGQGSASLCHPWDSEVCARPQQGSCNPLEGNAAEAHALLLSTLVSSAQAHEHMTNRPLLTME